MKKLEASLKRWDSSGEEQKFLDNLFKENKIEVDAKPNSIRLQHTIFAKFSADVFRAHFNLARQKFGLGRK